MNHNRNMKRFGKTWHGWLGLAVLAGATAASLAGTQWVRTWFYQFAWWGYILMADAFIQARAGNSLIVNRRSTFWIMCYASAAFWFAWELINLRLMNWHYLGVPREVWLRWPGAVIAYATVLPGVLSTYELLGVLGLSWGREVRPFPAGDKWKPWFYATGAILFILPLLFPKLFFPFVWVSLIFLLEPINHSLGAASLIRRWQRGDISSLIRLLLAGLICGFLWESWNFLADARWVYTLSYLSRPRLFAMPLAGYAGFAPFAVECYVFFASVSLLRGGKGWEAHDYLRASRPPLAPWLAWSLILAVGLFDLLMLWLIDLYLVKGWV